MIHSLTNAELISHVGYFCVPRSDETPTGERLEELYEAVAELARRLERAEENHAEFLMKVCKLAEEYE